MVGTQKFLSMQICDYGLAKWLPEQWTHLTISEFEGTFGFVERNIFYFLSLSIKIVLLISLSLCSYLPPEFLMHGIVDEKTDVFAFGVLLLELISGRRALDYSQQSLVMWVRVFHPI